MKLGPVEYAVIAFPGVEFSGQIAPALADLIERGLIRVVDLVFVRKVLDGMVETVELDALPQLQAAPFATLDGEITGLLSDEDIAELAAELPLGSSAMVVVWEDTWAAPLAEAVRANGGQLLARETVPHEIVQAAVRALQDTLA